MIAIKNSTKRRDILCDALTITWCEFVEHTTIHGLRYILDEQGNKFTRFGILKKIQFYPWTDFVQFKKNFRTLWLIVTIVGFIASNVLVDTFWLRYKDNPTRLNVESFHMPFNTLDLPAITICQVKHIDEERALKFIDEL